MWPSLLVYGWLKVNYFGLYLVVALVWMSFVLWRRLRIDVPETSIFGLTISLVIGVLLGNVFGSLVDTGRWFSVSGWGIALGGGWAFWRWCGENKVDAWEMFDWVSLMGLWFWFFGAIAYGPQARPSMIAALVSILFVSLVKANYRKFKFYRSGRVGIVGLATIVSYSVYEIAMGIMTPVKIYWWGLTLGQTVFAWVFAVSVIVVYLRGGNRFRI